MKSLEGELLCVEREIFEIKFSAIFFAFSVDELEWISVAYYHLMPERPQVPSIGFCYHSQQVQLAFTKSEFINIANLKRLTYK